MQTYRISTGRSRLETQWKTRGVSWTDLVKRLSSFKRTDVTFAEYQTMTKDERSSIKDVGGFVGGVLTAPQRKACNMGARSLVTLDIDYGTDDVIGIVGDMLAGNAWCLYSTHSHSPQAPRYRLVLPLSREVTPDEYVPIARKVAESIGMDYFDDSTYQPERLMYWPAAAKDAETVFEQGEGAPVDADVTLAQYMDWRNVTEWPTSSRVQKLISSRGTKQMDPTQKDGIIGTFCRAYSISEAIATFLPDTYEQVASDRYTYLKGSTAGGAVSYEDKWLYSHHGTDPCCDRLCNSFDLVRIHLYGDSDAEAKEGTPVAKLPSFSRMRELIGSDDRTRLQIGREALCTADDFKADEVEDDSWMKALEWNDRKGKPRQLANTPANYVSILRNHPDFKGALMTDDFSHNRLLTRDIPGHKMDKGKYWTDEDDLRLLLYFSEAPFFAQGKQNIIDAARIVAEEHSVHPVREYLKSLVWDGKPRLDTLIIDYLGAQDNELNRAMTRKHFCAAVKRVFFPGCKHDGVLSLDGPQGIGKSTLIKIMGGEWFSDTSIKVDKANETGMQLQGTWLLELAELTDYKKSTVEAYKNFISSCEDRVRIPYDRSYQNFPRQCVIFASTNDKNFLKGDTGNRRFWIIPVGESPATKNVFEDLEAERDQIWAEAYAKFRTEPLDLGVLEAELYERQAGHNEMADDLRVDMIRSYMMDEVPSDWKRLSRMQRREWHLSRTVNGLSVPDETLIQRPPVSFREIAEECLNVTRYDAYTKKTLRALLEFIGVESVGPRTDAAYGSQKRYRLTDEDEIY